MTFLKPSTVTTQAGAYNYKAIVPSPPQNYIDNQFPNCLDKTNGDTITGSISIASGGNINLLSGAQLVLQGGSDILTLGGSAAVFGGTVLLGGAVSLTAVLTISGSGSIVVNSGRDIELKSGSTLLSDAGSHLTLNGTINTNLNFDPTLITPTIGQPSISSGPGSSMTLQGQATSQAGASGGAVSINGGDASTGPGGNVFIGGGISSDTSGGNINLLGGSATSTINMYNAFGILLGVGQAGLQMGQASIGLVAGTNTLPSSVYQYNWIRFTSFSLTGNATIVFPSGFGPAVWMCDTGNIAFNGHNVSFRAGVGAFNGPITNTSNVNFWFAVNADGTCTLIGETA